MSLLLIAANILMSPDEKQVLLIFRKKPPYANHYAFIGGKTEKGEGLKESLFRETLEESQVRLESAVPCFILNESYYEGNEIKGHFLIHYWKSSCPPFPKKEVDEGILEWFPAASLPTPMVPSDQRVLDFVCQNPNKIGLGDCILLKNESEKIFLKKWIMY